MHVQNQHSGEMPSLFHEELLQQKLELQIKMSVIENEKLNLFSLEISGPSDTPLKLQLLFGHETSMEKKHVVHVMDSIALHQYGSDLWSLLSRISPRKNLKNQNDSTPII